MTNVSRRDFTKGALAAGVGLAASGAGAWARPLGANGDIRVAIVGVRKKGVEHIKAFGQIPGVRIVALCDADRAFLDRERKKLADAGRKVEGFVDYRKLLEKADVDAVVISTPDHWHGLMTVWACQAGKDVYVEKPLSHNIWEGRKMVEAVRKYKRIAQVGSQNRSDDGLRPAAEYIRKGELGRVKLVRAISYGYRQGIGKVDGPQPIPPTVDYDLFVGPAPMRPLMREYLHYDWHWFWDTGTGEMGNLGAHNLDESRWFMGQDKPPPRVVSLGGRLGFYDDGETANTQITLYDYRPVPLLYEIRNLPRSVDLLARDHYRGTGFGMVVECEGGSFVGGRGGGWAYDEKGKKFKQFPGDGGGTHQANFIEAMRSRKAEDLRSEILEGHISAALCHLGNISYRLGTKKSPREIQKDIEGSDLLSEAFDRLLVHAKANEIDLDKERLAVGPSLDFDAEKERFTGEYGDWANMFLKRTYRPPYVLRDKV